MISACSVRHPEIRRKKYTTDYHKMPVLNSEALKSLYFVSLSPGRNYIMDDILKKLRYREQDRIAVINSPEDFRERITGLLPDVQIDTEINARYLYDFMIAFTPASTDVERLGPACIHNLSTDGKLWMAYPKGTSHRDTTDINRDSGWQTVEETGFRRVSQVAIDSYWSALRFRNARYVKSGK